MTTADFVRISNVYAWYLKLSRVQKGLMEIAKLQHSYFPFKENNFSIPVVQAVYEVSWRFAKGKNKKDMEFLKALCF